MSMPGSMKSLAERFGVKLPNSTPEAGLQAALAAMESELRPHLLKHCGASETTYTRGFRGIDVRFTDDPNGFVSTGDGWKSFRITINSGLMLFLHQMSKLVSSVVGVMDDHGIKETTKIPFSKTVDAARSLMEAFWTQQLRPGLSFWMGDLSDSQNIFSAMTLANMERFVVGHELGHVACHLNPRLDDLRAGRSIAALMKNIAGKHGADWGEEYAADIVGMRLVIELQGSDMMRMTAYGAVELFFILLDMLEKYRIKTGGPAEFGTHPPSELRFAVLRKVAGQSNPPAILQMGDAFSAFAKSILEKV